MRFLKPVVILCLLFVPVGVWGISAFVQASLPPEVTIEWTSGGPNGGGGTLRNNTGRHLKNVALETDIDEPVIKGGIQTGIEKATYHALFLTVSQEAQWNWNIQTMRVPSFGGREHYDPRDFPARRETEPAPPAELGPHEAPSFYLHKTDTRFPLNVRVTSDGHPLRVKQVPPPDWMRTRY